jgi:hypothetical protein
VTAPPRCRAKNWIANPGSSLCLPEFTCNDFSFEAKASNDARPSSRAMCSSSHCMSNSIGMVISFAFARRYRSPGVPGEHPGPPGTRARRAPPLPAGAFAAAKRRDCPAPAPAYRPVMDAVDSWGLGVDIGIGSMISTVSDTQQVSLIVALSTYLREMKWTKRNQGDHGEQFPAI